MVIDLVGITGMGKCKTTAHLLAEGMGDEVAERAMEYALAEDGPCNMVEKVQKAEEDIEAEKAEKERLRLEAVARYEAALRRDKIHRINGEVRYTAEQVTQGHGGSNYLTPKSRARMPFGKFKGESVTDLPDWYLKGCTTGKVNITKQWLLGAIYNEIARRQAPIVKMPPLTVSQPFHDQNPSIEDINKMLMGV